MAKPKRKAKSAIGQFKGAFRAAPIIRQSTLHKEIRFFMFNPAFNESFASARTGQVSGLGNA